MAREYFADLNSKVDDLQANKLDKTGTAADSDKLRGYLPDVSAVENTVAVRNSLGDLRCRLVRAEFSDENAIAGAIAYRIDNNDNNYIRFCNDTTAIKNWLGIPDKAADSDKLDGLDSSQFLRSDADATTTGRLTALGNYTDNISVKKTAATDYCGFALKDQNSASRWILYMQNNEKGDLALQGRRADGAFQWNALVIDNNTGFVDFPLGITRNAKKIWGEDNDGAGSGLDADKLDGLDSSAFAQLAQSNTFLSTFKANYTQHGFTTSTLKTFSSGSDWAKPQGWSGMVNSSSAGMPASEHSYWTILGRRDVNGGYGGLLAQYGSGRIWYGSSDDGTKLPVWRELTNQVSSLSNTATSVVQAEGSNAYGDYRIWSDGTREAWGSSKELGSNEEAEIQLPILMPSEDGMAATVGVGKSESFESPFNFRLSIQSRNSIKIKRLTNSQSKSTVTWHVRGKQF